MRVLTIVCMSVLAGSALRAAMPTPARPITDPKAITSEPNASAKPLPLAYLGYTRDLLSAA